MADLTELLTPDTIAVHVHADDWEAAIRHAGQLLVDSGTCTPDYTGEMIDTVRDNGPYIVIAPGLAFAHARPSPAVHRTGMSLTVLAEPVAFGHPDNDPVSLVVALAATDPDTHLSAMRQLARSFRPERKRVEITRADSPREVHRILSGDPTGTRREQARPTSATTTVAEGTGTSETVPSKGLILTVCGNGLGTSLFLKNTLEDVLDGWGWSRHMRVEATDTISAKGRAGDADCILTSGEIARALGDLGVPVRVISDFTSTDEIDAALRGIYAV
ncbi:PTS sugar transporter subunit IIA [Corynebacterium pygosceleis]|uniref:Ascorbate-specific PTS system EIIA component n=1 Tax=Corynebacterium pygosceleis TaxID=2800406 RepID=A0A9Q4GHM9_9CORY|nr:PTS sugar transporter subunit IIA [Corynebacterium pygosceleis]MCK7636785.1 PTS sugar transporter subunit IIA [Corynebacterium pygosceleis]MCK7674259.1 PTS sugar transporter subunit IIA [Corynebacterium pygosceleis]MCL0120443.1 PTS sugar transporter subunit IIA [Corynebacterium pygosceleis]MCX7443990.1 PTS sugar transporter subunit IIA [Corynebacterium pygosceleis]MCX7467538.1 PTS sugar transporter subunit IIA [Corynebacterium pygosceleis]